MFITIVSNFLGNGVWSQRTSRQLSTTNSDFLSDNNYGSIENIAIFKITKGYLRSIYSLTAKGFIEQIQSAHIKITNQ